MMCKNPYGGVPKVFSLFTKKKRLGHPTRFHFGTATRFHFGTATRFHFGSTTRYHNGHVDFKL